MSKAHEKIQDKCLVSTEPDIFRYFGVQRFNKKFLTMQPKSTILIVDDQLAMHEVLEGLLSPQGYDLAFASNGKEALTKAAQLMPDVILLDVMMPGMDGFEVCQHLRADAVLGKVPIIMVTALDDRESRLQALKMGADDFVSKPYDNLELRARVQSITNLNRYRRLLTEQNKFKWMIEKTDEAYLLLNNDNQILYANSKARFYLSQSLSKDESITESFLELVAKHYHQVDATQEKPLPIDSKLIKLPRYLVRPETKNAQAFWLQVDMMEMETDSDEKYLIHLRDVTDTIVANRQQWTLHSQINHKLRTPLIGFSGSQYLLDNFRNFAEAKIEKWLKMINDGRIRLQSEIEEILDYMAASSMPQCKQEPCFVTHILLIITTISERLGIKDVHLSLLDEIEDVCIAISPQGVEIILTEIFSNAKKFHPKETPTVEVKIAKKPENICLQVCDDGIALSPEQLANMWMPYYQGEKYFTGEIKGVGLGLSMVASLIWEAGGTCQAYNCTQKEGVTIELNLPYAANNFEL